MVLSSVSTDTLKKIQAASGLLVGTFMALHLTSLVVAHLGPAFYNNTLSLFRKYYHNPIVELCVGFCIVMHASTGVLLYLKRRNISEARDTAEKLNRWSGWFIATAIGMHFFGTRYPSLSRGSDYLADFSRISFVLEVQPYMFYPFFSLWACVGFFHTVYGFLKAMAVLNVIKFDTFVHFRRSFAFFGFILSGTLLMVSSVIVFTRGLLYDVSTDKYPLWQSLL